MNTNVFKQAFLILGVIAAIGLVGYSLTYLVVMPEVNPTGFVPNTLENSIGVASLFGTMQAVFVLLYALAFVPVAIMFTIKRYSENPYALVFAGCLLGISLLIEILNSLPLLATQVYPGQLENISPEVLLYLNQTASIRYLSYDVAGFTMAYVAIFVYAIVYFRSNRLLSYAVIGSIVLFIANVPFLWFVPNVAVILMAVSVMAFAAVPIFLAKMCME